MLQELTPGSVVAERFEVERLAGSGGMGAVYRAYDRWTGQPVALKVLFDGADKVRFTREALLLAELSHPGIVGYVSHGHLDGGSPFLAMQWLSGHDLAERLRHGGLNLKETLQLARRVAEALSVAHQRGVVHRDIKPSNLFLVDGEPSKAVLLDFGIARRGFGRHSAAMTRTGAIVGTPEYMAPEQARGQSQLTLSADIFSLGCVFHECLTGAPPFVAAHVAAVLAKILFEEAPPLRSLRPELPPALEQLLQKMLHKDPTQRLPSAGAVLSELLALPELPTMQGPSSDRVPLSPSIRASEQQLVSVFLVSDVSEVSSIATLALADDAEEVVESFAPKGDLKAERFAGLQGFAEKHDPLILDFSVVTRIDFVSAGTLVNLLSPIKRQGKRVIINHPNHLVAELLGVVGLKAVADIVLAKT